MLNRVDNYVSKLLSLFNKKMRRTEAAKKQRENFSERKILVGIRKSME